MTGIVSDAAKRSFEQIFTRAVSHLALSAEDGVVVETLPPHRDAGVEGDAFYILTIANFFFRTLVLFHFREDAETAAYFSRQDGKLGFSDVFPEVCNLCCGAMNRELLSYFPHLGMSTPERLGQACLPFMARLHPTETLRFHMRVADRIDLFATLAICTYRPLDFRANPQVYAAQLQDTGVLELF